MTFFSRVLGLARDIVIADKIGVGLGAEVFFFANRIPNFLRRLFAEGAFAQAFVPVMSEVKHQYGDQEVRLVLAKVSGTLGIIVTIVTLVAMLITPVIVGLFGFGWFLDWLNDEPGADKFELATLMLRITFPYLWFITFVALSGAILNLYNHFAVAAFSPVLLNVAMITAAIYLESYVEPSAIALAIGVFIGGLLQFLLQIPFLIKAKLLVKPQWDWHHPAVSKIRKLIIPVLFGVSVNQINLLLDTIIASFLITGSISWLYYADRLLEFPLGIFGIGIATVILPYLAREHTQKSQERFFSTLEWGVKITCLVGIPALAGLVILAQPILMVLFMRGQFTEFDVTQVSAALVAYAFGLVNLMLVKVLANAFFSRQQPKIPVRIGIQAMFVNIVFNFSLAPLFGYVGLAAATSISGTVNAVLLFYALKKQNIFYLRQQTILFIIKIIFSAVVMAATLYYITPQFNEWLALDFWTRIISLGTFVVIGIASYISSLLVVGIRPHSLVHQ